MQYQTINVPHLGGTTASYILSSSSSPRTKPTLVLINSFATSAHLYRPQFASSALSNTFNILAIDVLGHGNARTKSSNWTFWDSATVNLQVIEKLGLGRGGDDDEGGKGKVFVLGTSQGGFVAVRMALLAPELISGIIIMGTSLDSESERTRKLGCWDAHAILSGAIDELSTTAATPDFAFDNAFCDLCIDTGFGGDMISQEDREFWRDAIKTNWGGDDGRKRARMSAICLRDRDGLRARVFDVACPVLWIQGTADVVYSVANATEEIQLFVNSSDARLQIVEGGHHYLSFSNPDETNSAILDFVEKHG